MKQPTFSSMCENRQDLCLRLFQRSYYVPDCWMWAGDRQDWLTGYYWWGRRPGPIEVSAEAHLA